MDMHFELPVDSRKSLPTLRKFLEQDPAPKLKGKYVVMKVWLPNKYPYITFETEDFKVSLAEDSPAFSSVYAFFMESTENNTGMAIKVTESASSGNYTFSSDTETGSWSTMGQYGWEFKLNTGTPRNKRTTKKSSL